MPHTRALLCVCNTDEYMCAVQLSAQVVYTLWILYIYTFAVMQLASVAVAARPMNGNGIFSQFRHVDIKRLQFFSFLYFLFHLDFWLFGCSDDVCKCIAVPTTFSLYICTRSYDFISIFSHFVLYLNAPHSAFKCTANVNINRIATRHLRQQTHPPILL